jgi:hypothetical protein
MEEGFFLNGVQMDSTWIPIDQAVIFPISIFPYPAKTSSPFGDTATMRAKFALDFSSFEGSKVGRKFRFDETFLGHLGLRGFRKAHQIGQRKGTEAGPTKL